MNSPATTPQNIDAEKAVLGACLISPETLPKTLQALASTDFADTRNRVIFEAVRELSLENKAVDYLTIADKLKAKGYLDRIGGTQYLLDLASAVPTTANINSHIELVHEYSLRRKLISAADVIKTLAGTGDMALASILEKAEELIFNASQNKPSDEFLHVSGVLKDLIATVTKKSQEDGKLGTGRSTGLADLDALTGGLQPGSLNILAARPSMGKTALALNIAQFGAARSGKPVLIFSLEMPAEHLVMRMIAAEASINLSSLMRGTITSDEFQMVKSACDTLAKLNIYINDVTTLSTLEFRAKCRQFHMRHPDTALIIVDYLQLMTAGDGRLSGNRNLEISEISRMLKAVAREMNCPVIALSQLSREAEKRPDKKPQLSDLRDSGAIEQDADLVMMLYRQDYYSDNENNDLRDSEADLRIAKNRNGSTGRVKLTFRRETTRFFNHGEDTPL